MKVSHSPLREQNSTRTNTRSKRSPIFHWLFELGRFEKCFPLFGNLGYRLLVLAVLLDTGNLTISGFGQILEVIVQILEVIVSPINLRHSTAFGTAVRWSHCLPREFCSLPTLRLQIQPKAVCAVLTFAVSDTDGNGFVVSFHTDCAEIPPALNLIWTMSSIFFGQVHDGCEFVPRQWQTWA